MTGKPTDPRSMNRFLYAEANPWTFSDPSGHATCYSSSDLCDETMAIRHQGTAGGQAALKRAANQDRLVHVRRRLAVKQSHLKVSTRSCDSDPEGTPTNATCTSSICNVAAPTATTEAAIQPCTAAKLDCSLSDIQGMTMNQRSDWMHDLATVTGGNEWFNALIGIVDAGGASGYDSGTWFGTVDSRVLYSMQAGYLRYTSGNTSGTNEAEKAWTVAWKQILSRSQLDPDKVNAAIAASEDASIKIGRSDAEALHRSPSKGEWMAMVGANTFRLGQSNRAAVSAAVQVGCFVSAACPSELSDPGSSVAGLFDERNYKLARGAATALFAQSFNPLMPDWSAADPVFPPH